MAPTYTKLDIDRTHAPVVRKLMNDNSGAAIVLIELLSRGRGFGTPVGEEAAWCLTTLDSLGIYGADLHIFWVNVCDYSIERMRTVLRACDEGHNDMNRNSIMQAIACCSQGSVPIEL